MRPATALGEFTSVRLLLAKTVVGALPLILLAVALPAQATELRFQMFEKDKKPFLMGVFDVVLTDQIFDTATAPLPQSISITENPFGLQPFSIVPSSVAITPGNGLPAAIVWTGTYTPVQGSAGYAFAPSAVNDPLLASLGIGSDSLIAAAQAGSTWGDVAGFTFSLQVAYFNQGQVTLTSPSDGFISFDAVPNPPNPDSVPGPLPLLGLGAAFGASRKLRKRLRSTTPWMPAPRA
jgi:hypothetical protein